MRSAGGAALTPAAIPPIIIPVMRYDVRLFALYRERAGAAVVSVDLPAGAVVGDLTAAVRADYPRLAPPEVRIVVAVNAEYADDDQRLKPGDEVCLIPPVSGGR